MAHQPSPSSPVSHHWSPSRHSTVPVSGHCHNHNFNSLIFPSAGHTQLTINCHQFHRVINFQYQLASGSIPGCRSPRPSPFPSSTPTVTIITVFPPAFLPFPSSSSNKGGGWSAGPPLAILPSARQQSPALSVSCLFQHSSLVRLFRQ